MILSHARPLVKTVVLFSPAMIRSRINPRFGFGVLAHENRLRTKGYTLADVLYVKGATAPETAPEENEAYGEFLNRTLSPIRFHGLMEEVAEMASERQAVMDEAREEGTSVAETPAETPADRFYDLGACDPADDEEMEAMAYQYDAEMVSHGFADRLYDAVVADGSLDFDPSTDLDPQDDTYDAGCEGEGREEETVEASPDRSSAARKPRPRRVNAAKVRRLATKGGGR